MARQFTSPIIDGPDKFALMEAIFSARKPLPSLEFTHLSDGLPFLTTVQLNSVEREDGSGHSWNLTGHFTGGSHGDFTHWKMYYSSKRRKGQIFFLQ